MPATLRLQVEIFTKVLDLFHFPAITVEGISAFGSVLTGLSVKMKQWEC